jgi:hypothetical protein
MMLASHVLEGKTVGTEQSWILEEMMKIVSIILHHAPLDAR